MYLIKMMEVQAGDIGPGRARWVTSEGGPVHLLGDNSMGGLDSRYMISRLDMAGRVLTLTTIGTPHRGSAFADWCIGRLGRILKPIFELCNFSHQAFYDLTTSQCREFNERVPDAPVVRYFSVAGNHEGDWRSPEWKPTALVPTPPTPRMAATKSGVSPALFFLLRSAPCLISSWATAAGVPELPA